MTHIKQQATLTIVSGKQAFTLHHTIVTEMSVLLYQCTVLLMLLAIRFIVSLEQLKF